METGADLRSVLCSLDAGTHYVSLLAGTALYLPVAANFRLLCISGYEISHGKAAGGLPSYSSTGMLWLLDSDRGDFSSEIQHKRLRQSTE